MVAKIATEQLLKNQFTDMKNYCLYILLLLVASCKELPFPGATESAYISIYDLRNVYKDNEVDLSKDNMFGATKISGTVISDHRGGNIDEDVIILQDRRRLNQLRGIQLYMPETAKKYVSGDSIEVEVLGGKLVRKKGMLQVHGLKESNIKIVAKERSIPVNRVNSNLILQYPERYESTLVAIVKGGFNPLPSPNDVFRGSKVLNDGFGNLELITNDRAEMQNDLLPSLANYYGIIFLKEEDGVRKPYHKVRSKKDIVVLSAERNFTPIMISGFISDVKGADNNREYVQLLAAEDIDFSVTPYSIVFTLNNQGTLPAGLSNGWAAGGARSYKMNMTAGTVKKGNYFYVGGSAKLINGAGSTSIAQANWIKAHDYTKIAGDGFGTVRAANLMINSGASWGIGVFKGTTVTKDTRPIDCVFQGNLGTFYLQGPPEQGYLICNNDMYDVVNPVTLQEQPYFFSGTNTLNFVFTAADMGYFYELGGRYNVTLGRWTAARTQNLVLLTTESKLEEIETAKSTKLEMD